MTTEATGGSGRRQLGDVLVEQGAITAEQLQVALDTQRAVADSGRRIRLGALLVQLGLASDRQVAAALAGAMSVDLLSTSAFIDVDSELGRLLPRAVAERHEIVPIRRDPDGRVMLVCSDPTNVLALDDVRLYLRSGGVRLVVATSSQVRDLINRVWSLRDDNEDVAQMWGQIEVESEERDLADAAMDAPTTRLVSSILADAVRARASDIHVEPQGGEVRVRYRIDGLLRDVMSVPRNVAGSVVSRIKVMSNLDIAERRLPQDGRTRLTTQDGISLDARVSTLPSIHGEKVVIRLLARADSVTPVTELGMDDSQLEQLLGSLAAPQGLILITGPTGSGKTNTLYSGIEHVKSPDRNIVTLEDPVEIQVNGITQVQVHERAGLTFARGLRSVLRQDPDIVLVGEVRDEETAKLALEASLTGHLVLTTLHTNSAPAALTRLIEMGVEPFLVASSLSLVVAQRLVRRVCRSCAAPYEPPERVLALLGIGAGDLASATPKHGAGCNECGGTGYLGRVGVFEVVPVTAAMRAILLANPNESVVAAAAMSEGMQTLRAAALLKAHRGITSYEEVLRVTQIDSGSGLHCATCGGAVNADMLACPWCGTSIDRGHCEACDRPLERDWRVCPWCRTPRQLRAAVPIQQSGDSTPAAAPTASVAADAAPPRSLPRVLVVEDDPSVRAYVKTVLVGTLDVDSVGTAADALELLAEQQYAAVLVDHLLPDMSGVELIRLLKKDAETAGLPVMFFTGDASAGLEAEARDAGADDYLGKPVEPALLEERLLALVQLGTAAPQ